MAVPQGLTLKHHRDLADREARPVARWFLVALLALVLVLALFNLYGQRVEVTSADSSAARFEVSSPTKLRGGIFFQARFTVEAIEEIRNATIVLEPGWLEDITLNTLAPAPIGEASRDGRIALELGRVPPGDEHRLYLHFQVNPTAVGRRSQDVELYDGDELLLSLDRDAIVWP